VRHARDANELPVTITLNGIAHSTSYGGSDSDGSGIASRLAALISAGPYANATAAGSTVSLTSKTSRPGERKSYHPSNVASSRV
jgi:hypothetical protein